MTRVWPPSPFWLGEANWGDNGLFLSREQLLNRLDAFASTPGMTAVVLCGPRRMGKTSVLKRLEERWLSASDGRSAPVISEDLRDHLRNAPSSPGEFGNLWASLHDRLVQAHVLERDSRPVRDLPTLAELWRHRCDAGDVPRVRILIDEVELLYQRDPRLLVELLHCFRRAGDRQPAFLLLSWGDWLGSTLSTAVSGALKGTPREWLGPIIKEDLMRGMDEAFTSLYVPLTKEANERLWVASQGHPFYAMAIASQLYNRRVDANSSAPIEAEEINRQLLRSAAECIDFGLKHAWDQVSRAQHALCWGLAQLSVRPQNPLEGPREVAERSFSTTRVLEYLREQGRHSLDDTLLRSATRGLADNRVIEPAGEDRELALWRIRSPFFAEWLASHSFEALDPDTRRTEEGSGKSAADLLVESRQASEAGRDDDAATLLRRARHLAPLHPEILLEAARVARRQGELGEAASLLRDARIRSDAREIQEELAEVVERRILAALADGDDPLAFWIEYRELSRLGGRPLELAAVRGVIDAFAQRWQEQVEEGQARDALATVRRIQQDAAGPTSLLPGWRARFLEHYAVFMRSHPHSRERLQRCLSAIFCGFLPLTEESSDILPSPTPDQPLSLLPEPLYALLSELAPRAKTFGDLSPKIANLLSQDLVRRSANQVSEEWLLTLDVLETAGRGGMGLPPELDDKCLRSLILRAPAGVQEKLKDLLRSYLVGYAICDVRVNSRRAEDLIALLRELQELEGGRAQVPLDALMSTIDERMLSLDSVLFEEVEAAFRALPGLLRRLLDWPGPGGAPRLKPQDAVQLAQMIVAVARRGGDKERWGIIARQPAAVRAWRELIRQARDMLAGAAVQPIELQIADQLAHDMTLPEDFEPLALPDASEPDGDREIEQLALETAGRLLDRRYYHVERVVRTGGLIGAHHLVWRFHGKWRRTERDAWSDTHIKLFRLPGDDSATREFLEALWSHERRVLFEIGSRRLGRVLADLRSAEFKTQDGYLVLVTEPVGPVTLRDLLRNGRAGTWRFSDGQALWRELMSLMQGVQALHEAHYMHRNLRPETIHVRIDKGRGQETFRFRLVDFEWSIYLHAFQEAKSSRRRHRDYYCAPEVLLTELDANAGDEVLHGEAFASDLYALGLVFFELLVRPLTQLELGEFLDRRSYSVQAHREFILRLRDEVQDPRHRLGPEQQLLVLGLLRFDASSRTTSLHSGIIQARNFALGADGLQSSHDVDPLPVVATLLPGSQDAIASYIHRFPGIQERLDSVEATRSFIEEELRGARIFENATSRSHPIFIEGRRVNFTATPFIVGGSQFDQLAYLWVATRLDVPRTGEPLVHLRAGVKVYNLLPEEERKAHFQQGDARWSTLFSLVGDFDEPSTPDEQREQSLLHEALRLTGEAEEALVEELIVAYRIVRGPAISPKARFEQVVIGPRAVTPEENANPNGEWRLALRRTVAQQTEHDGPDFELTARHSISDWFQHDRIWQAQEVDAEDENVVLVRRAGGNPPPPKPPDAGWLRPGGIVGSQALVARRRGLLRRLAGDRFLLRSICRPIAVHQEIPVPEPQYFLDLDEDKKRIVRRMQTTRPMLLVQGPPGTGKTTLAAEVVLQALAASASSRILVTAQGHDPLNHLLRTVADQIEANRPTRQKAERIPEVLLVRLVPERRLSTTEELGGPGREMEIRYNPARVARGLLDRSLQWEPDDDAPVDPDLRIAWRRFVDEQRGWSITEEMQRRVVNSANIVCATANDRTIEYTFQSERPFDLLIYEEAGRALPLELLGPMTGASRWLLIGDPEQLPPHQATDLARILERGLSADAEKDRVHGTRLSSRRQKAIALLEMFRHLWSMDNQQVLSDRLSLQYRMHPAISDSISKTYYRAGELHCADPSALRATRKHRIMEPRNLANRAIVWIDLPRAAEQSVARFFEEEPSSRGGYTNHAEVHAIQRFLGDPKLKLRRGPFRAGELVFLSPYRAQVERFRRVFATWTSTRTGPLHDIAHTVDSFQGRQAEVVIVSLVRNNDREHVRAGLGFLKSPARSVVMFSRAQSLLVVVGSSAHFSAFRREESPVRRFFEHVSELEAAGDALILPASQLFDAKSYRYMEEHWLRREQDRQERRGWPQTVGGRARGNNGR